MCRSSSWFGTAGPEKKRRGGWYERAVSDAAEREILEALRQSGGLTPTTAAARTSLSVTRAADVLERLAVRGHLEARPREGTLVYALCESDRRVLEGTADPSVGARQEEGIAASPEPPVETLEEPLSERELEVLRLLASGQTNRQIAQDLFVAPGTAKAHVANVYRKLEAHSRAEAISKARDLGLLR